MPAIAQTIACVVAIGILAMFAHEINKIAIMSTIRIRPALLASISDGTIPFPMEFTTGAPAMIAPRSAKMAIKITACFFVRTPAPYEVAIDAAALFAPMLRARKTDKITAIITKMLNSFLTDFLQQFRT